MIENEEDYPISCECCGGNMQECICEFGEVPIQETREHPIYYVEYCLTHKIEIQ